MKTVLVASLALLFTGSLFGTGVKAADPKAVSALVEALTTDKDAEKSQFIHEKAAAALVKIGAPAAPALIARMSSSTEGVPRRVAQVLIKIRPSASDVQPLIKALNENKDEFVRWHAAEALGNLGPDAKDAVPTLVELLKTDKEPEARYGAAIAVGKVGLASKEVLQALAAGLKDEAKFFRQGQDGGAVGASVVEGVVEAFGRLGRPAVPDLLQVLRNEKEAGVRANAAWALGTIGPTAKDAVEDLTKILQGEEDLRLRMRAAEALGNIEAQSK